MMKQPIWDMSEAVEMEMDRLQELNRELRQKNQELKLSLEIFRETMREIGEDIAND